MDSNFEVKNVEDNELAYISKLFKKIRWLIYFLIVFSVFFLIFTKAPQDFPQKTFFEIKDGATLNSVSKELKERKIIHSSIILQAIVIYFGREKGVIAGDYYFDKPVSVLRVASMITSGNYNYDQIKITIPEGFRRDEMAKVLEKFLPNFDKELFLVETEKMEGYLFPDTYFFSPNTETKDVISRMNSRFKEVIKDIDFENAKNKMSLEEMITLASIVEKEGAGEYDRPIIAGILLNRLEIGMALQVDASFLYISGKGSSELTKKDLEMDHPYNTYKNKGLPPGPIGSPGEASIKATLNPIKTDYLYYLHGKDGTAYFAKTYEEHLQNKRKYLD